MISERGARPMDGRAGKRAEGESVGGMSGIDGDGVETYGKRLG
ncbi:hypothetical protein [Nonomuraea sp. NPDC050643]